MLTNTFYWYSLSLPLRTRYNLHINTAYVRIIIDLFRIWARIRYIVISVVRFRIFYCITIIIINVYMYIK